MPSPLFLVDRYVIRIAVRPVDKVIYTIRHGSKESKVVADNWATIDRVIEMSRNNECSEQFALRYSTRGTGLLTGALLIPQKNEALPAELGEYHDHGKKLVYRFTPQAGKKHQMRLEVVNGFDAFNRDAHFHLHANTLYETIVVELDLTGYAKYPVTEEPSALSRLNFGIEPF